MSAFIRIFALTTAVAGFLSLTGAFSRNELQNLNTLFEARPWVKWSHEGASRLNPSRLFQYHEQHEIPRDLWHWDFTLSWLLEPNHPKVEMKYVIFNHLVEDEPPLEALASHPWMEPLTHYPTSRKTIAEVVEYLAKSGVKAIILDNDFPQYSSDDQTLASAIHSVSSGAFSGKPVPILMAGTVNRRASGGLLQLDSPTKPAGVLRELEKLEPGVNVENKYVGLPSMVLDEDQVLRRMLTVAPDNSSEPRQALPCKLLAALGTPIPQDLPMLMDIDFACPPANELVPVRPFSYLLDPAKRVEMRKDNTADVSLKDAIVILGDGITDCYATPGTNLGVNLMSGSEILAHATDTLIRRSWPSRLNSWQSAIYVVLFIAVFSLLAAFAGQVKRPDNWNSLPKRFSQLASNLLFYFALLTLPQLAAIFAFAYLRLFVPSVDITISIACGALFSLILERDRATFKALKAELKSTQVQLEGERISHEAQLKLQTAEAERERVVADQIRRKEFVRRINHDLKAPVTVLNWTLASSY